MVVELLLPYHRPADVSSTFVLHPLPFWGLTSTYKRDTVYIIFTRSHYNCINTPTTTHYKYVFHYPYQNGRWKSRLDNLLTFVEDVFEYYWDESSGVKVLRWVWRPLCEYMMTKSVEMPQWVYDDKKLCLCSLEGRGSRWKCCVC